MSVTSKKDNTKEYILADDVINQKGSYLNLKGVSLMMVTSRLLGTLLAQVFFIPGQDILRDLLNLCLIII
ncbi:lipid II flippase family protein [Peribacillus butanolivorans]|uniref:lipid II flippase family protein n=1 Tax=Peribacillus butanolivorans TaxID=421767 RepID=UPI003651FBDD